MKNTSLVLVLGLSLGLPGCWGASCTELGCGDDGATLHFDHAWGGDQGVSYVFTVAFDGIELSCSAVIGGDQTCDDGLELWGFTSGREPNQTVGLDALVLDDYPGATQVIIERDGIVVFEDEVDIIETVDRPNGSSCPPECRFWSGEAAW